MVSVLFGVAGLQVTEAGPGAGGTLEVRAVTDHPAAGVCPDCATPARRVHEYVLARPRDVRRGPDRVDLCWVKRRWKCDERGARLEASALAGKRSLRLTAVLKPMRRA